MAKPLNITGQRFGRLLVIRRESNHLGYALWLCQCDCGNTRSAYTSRLKTGRVASCGCGGDGYYRHGYTRLANGKKQRHPLYATWSHIRKRCNNPNDQNYRLYGGRGITVDPRWENFANFLADVGERPSPGLTIDRINNDGNYERSNVRWATRKEQRANRRPAHKWPSRLSAIEKFSTAELMAELKRRKKRKS